MMGGIFCRKKAQETQLNKERTKQWRLILTAVAFSRFAM